MVNCPGCEGKNRDDARFCKFCGEDLFARCPTCGSVLDDDARFCDACGSRVGDTDATPAAPVAARKVVTVMFTDLTGSTALEERMDAESVRAILDRFYAAMRTEIERHSGRVVKFTGDGAMAAFGVPEVHEDDAARAIDAALSMREELAQLAADLQLDVSLKIGINTGEVVVTEDDDDVVGDAVNVAARLEGAATAGEILVGEDTWRLTRSTSRYEPIEPLVLKGKSEPVPAYRLLSVDERTADSAAAPFVGRQAELGRLLESFQDAVDANAARVVTIVGSPGLGKTRLARELLLELSDVARVRETRCDPTSAQTFAPIADLMRAATGVSETDSEADILAALTARLPPDDRDRDRIATRAAAILGVGVAGTTEETFWAIRRLIEAAASEQPVVLMLDDIHWAEPLMLDLIEHLAEWIRDAPVLLVGTARPELRDVRPSLTEGGRATVVALEGLDRQATAQLALNLLETDDLPAELLAKIPASTEGNPLFVRELVRMLVDDHVLVRSGDGWSTTVDVEAIEVPPTISSLLAARVDRLRSDERTVVELASVVGKEFYRGALMELVPPHVRDLVDGCLESLRRKELVEPVGTYWIDEPVYRFHHVLIRDAAYRRLLKDTRADVHERVAGWFERKTAGVLGEHDEVIAYHLEQAADYRRQLGGADLDLSRRAAALLGEAAHRALDRDDLPSAAALSGRALACVPDGEDRSELLLVSCEALVSMGDVVAGARQVDALERIADTPRLLAWVTCFREHIANLTQPEDLQETVRRVGEAAAALVALGDQAGAAKAHTVHAVTLARLGRFAECEGVLDDALTAARAADDRRRMTATLGFAPHAALWGPSPVSRAGGRCLDIVRLLRITTGSPAVEATSLRCQAVLEAFRGRADAARRMLANARKTLSDLGLRHELLDTDRFAGLVELVDAQPAAACTFLGSAYEGARKMGVDVLAAQSAALLARAHLMLDEVEEAQRYREVSEQLGSRDLTATIGWRSVGAELLARTGDHAAARSLALDAVELAGRTDASFDHGMACRSLATVLRAAGDAAGAQEAEQRALALFERKGATALIGTPSVRPVVPVERSGPVARERTAALRFLESNTANYEARDWTAFAARFDPRFVRVDHRLGLGSEVDREGYVRSAREAADLGMTHLELSPIAWRGERLVLARMTFAGDGNVATMLVVFELGQDERVVSAANYDVDDFDRAIADLEHRYMAGEGARFSAHVELGMRFYLATNVNDAEAFAATLAPDVILQDHRPATWGVLRGADEVVRVFGSASTVLGTRRAWTVRQVRISEGGGVAEGRVEGTTPDGVHFDDSRLALAVYRDGRYVRLEYFPLDAEAEAIARYEELLGEPVDHLDNRSLAVMREVVASLHRNLDSFPDFYTEDCVIEDRRRGLGVRISHDEIPGFARSQRDAFASRSYRCVATRGDRLALARGIWTSTDEGAFEAEVLRLSEIDGDGLVRATIFYDVEDEDAAFVDLDERYIAGEGAPYADILRLRATASVAYQARDWDTMRATFADDLVTVDHRPAGAGTIAGADGYIEYIRTMVDLADWSARTLEIVAIAPDRQLVRLKLSGPTAEGVEVESETHRLTVLEDGLQSRLEIFDPTMHEAALARFHALGVKQHGRAWDLLMELSADWEHVSSERVAEDIVLDDRRVGLRNRFVGRDAWFEHQQASVPGVDIQHEYVASRGDRLVLARVFATMRDGFKVEILGLHGFGADGTYDTAVLFDAADIDAVFDEMDERYIAGEGAAVADMVRFGSAVTKLWNARDWDALRRYYADDITFADHRRLGIGVLHGPDAVLSLPVAMADVVGDARYDVVNYVRITPNVVLTEIHGYGTNSEGGRFDSSYLQIAQISDGLAVAIDRFDLTQRDEAIAQFERLLGAEHNEAWRSLLRFEGHSGDPRELEELVSEDYTLDDRRSGLTVNLAGREAFWEHRRVALPGTDIRYGFVASRGERLVLASISASARGGFDIELLGVFELDEAGRRLATVLFDPADIDAAFEELDARCIAGEGAHAAETIRVLSHLVRMWNAQDWEGMRRFYADTFVFIDHQLLGVGVLRGAEAMLDVHITMAAVAPDIRHDVIRYLRLEHGLMLGELRAHGTNQEGGGFENRYVVLSRVFDGSIIAMDRFALDQHDEACAMFDQLSSDRGPDLDNATMRHWRSVEQAINDRTWAPTGVEVSPDVVVDDRRSGLGNVMVGRELYLEQMRVITDMGAAVRHKTIAIRGDDLALFELTWYDPTGKRAFAVDVLHVHETAGGVTTWVAVFDPADIDAAFDALEDRFASGEGADAAETVRLFAGIMRSWNTETWNEMRGYMAPDVVMTDHRQLGFGRVSGVDGVIRAAEVKSDVVSHIRHDLVRLERCSATGFLAEIHARGTSNDGGDFDYAFLQSSLNADGVVTRIERFGLEQREEAIAMFDEWERDSAGLTNAAVRQWRRIVRAFQTGTWGPNAIDLADDVSLDDRRVGLAHVIDGRKAIMDALDVIAEMGAMPEIRVVATRGEGLALTEVRWVDATGRSGFEVDLLQVSEVRGGRFVKMVTFDPTDLTAAFDELEERYIAGEGAPYADVLSMKTRLFATHAARDWAAFTACFAPDVRFVDHRPASLGSSVGPQLIVDSMRGLVDLMPDIRFSAPCYHALARGCGVTEIHTSGTDTEGGWFDFRFHVVSAVFDGLVTVFEYFPLERLDDAMARFEELRSADDDTGLTNAAVRQTRRLELMFQAGAWDPTRFAVADDILVEDRRVGLANVTVGRDAYLEMTSIVADIGAVPSVHVLAIRGEFLAVTRVLWVDPTGRSGFEVELLHVDEVRDDVLVRMVFFDPTDLDAALDMLDELYGAGEGAAHADVLAVGLRLSRAYRARDWDAFGAGHAPDVRFVDHRPASMGTVVGPETIVESVRGLVDLMPDVRAYISHYHAIDGDVFVAELVTEGTDTQGGYVDLPVHMVQVNVDGRVAVREFFPLERLDDALARYEELRP